MQFPRTVLLFALGLFAVGPPLHAQQPRDRNLETCLSSKYPALCRQDLLKPNELTQVRTAERGTCGGVWMAAIRRSVITRC